MKKRNKKFQIAGKIFLVLLFSIATAYTASSLVLNSQNSTGKGSSDSVVGVSYPDGDPLGITSYVNKGNNSSIIGNYFSGYYYDDIAGFFKLDWSADTSKNVRIISSTSECGSGYGYKLGGYAYSETMGFIDFDYNSSIFVYYCQSDNKLHGYGYSQHAGFQNFEGIGFQIIPVVASDPPPTSGVFENEESIITSQDDPTSNVTVSEDEGYESQTATGTVDYGIFSIDDFQESIFYIIK